MAAVESASVENNDIIFTGMQVKQYSQLQIRVMYDVGTVTVWVKEQLEWGVWESGSCQITTLWR